MEDTIAAIATAYGEGGIGIVRISGPKAGSILNQIFVPNKEAEITNRKLIYGKIRDPKTEEIVDDVLAVYMKGPQTYTAEDVVEINCHGSMVSLRKTLGLALRQGSRLAEPGEFTKRAFLNGRMDLPQAEAVIDLVKAKTDKTFEVALKQMEGHLSAKIYVLRNKLLDILVGLTVNIDYPDEDIEESNYEVLNTELSLIGDTIEKLIGTADTGRIIRDGLNVVITGKPNVGKSSLMNALLKESRAIVTEIPGTTRDTIEELVSIKNIPVKLTDTAGIHHTENQIEMIGIEKSKESFNRADLIIFVLDSSRELSHEDREIMEYIGQRRAIVLINKVDLEQVLEIAEIQRLLPQGTIIETSMVDGTGVEKIEEVILDLVYGGEVRQNEDLLITNVRHKALLEKAAAALKDALAMVKGGEALDFIEVDVKSAYEYLGEIVGETVSDDIINEVFSRFCLGK